MKRDTVELIKGLLTVNREEKRRLLMSHIENGFDTSQIIPLYKKAFDALMDFYDHEDELKG